MPFKKKAGLLPDFTGTGLVKAGEACSTDLLDLFPSP